MSSLLRLQEKLLETGALIERFERASATHKATPATLANLRVLVRQRERLEHEFEETALRDEIDVYHYRLLPQATERLTLLGVSEPWKRFQMLFSVVYDALKSGPKQRGKLGAEVIGETALGFGYAYSGSLGVVLTLPNERLLFGETVLRQASAEVFKLAQSRTSEEIAASARRLGAPPVRALFNWVTAHVDHGLGAAVEWKRQDASAELLLQYPELEALRQTILLTSDTTESNLSVEGLLEGADVRSKTFKFTLAGGEPIEGKFSDAISEAHTVELPKRYAAVIRKTTMMQYATEEEKTTYFLVRLSVL